MNKQIKYSWESLDKDLHRLVEQISKDPDIVITSVYGIPRGGLVIAVCLSHLLDIPLVDAHKISQNTLVVDDVSDSGKTLEELMIKLKKKKLNPWTLTLFLKPKSTFKPSFFARKTVQWIIFPWETSKTSKYDS